MNLSNEELEIIDEARKRLARSKRDSIVTLLLSFGALLLTYAVFQLFMNITDSSFDETRSMSWIGLGLGIMFGMFIGFGFVKAIGQVGDALRAFHGSDEDRLLVKMYEEIDGASNQ